METKDLVPIEINLDVVRKIFPGASSKEIAIDNLKRAANGLMRKQFRYYDGLDFAETQILLTVYNTRDIDLRAIKLTINPELSKFFLNFKTRDPKTGKDKAGNYTSITHLNTLSLDPKSQAFYLEVKKIHGLEKFKAGYNTHFYLSKNELLEMYGIKLNEKGMRIDLSKKSKDVFNFYTFKINRLDLMINDINENSDIKIDCRLTKNKERLENTSITNQSADIYIKITYNEDGNSPIDELFIAKEAVLEKGKYIRNNDTYYEMIDFKFHPVLKNTISCILCEDEEEFTVNVTVKEMLREYAKTVKVVIDEITKIMNEELPGYGDHMVRKPS